MQSYSNNSTKIEKRLNFSITQLKEQLEQQKTLARVIQRIRKSLDLNTIFTAIEQLSSSLI